jgi:hypothetical protein
MRSSGTVLITTSRFIQHRIRNVRDLSAYAIGILSVVSVYARSTRKFLIIFIFSPAAQTVPVTSNIEIDNLKAKIAAVKADIRQEQGLCEGVPSEKLEVRLK